jgi:hypothetical protein
MKLKSVREAAVRILEIRLSQSKPCSPVRSVQYLPGGPGTPHGKECLLMLGGQDIDHPDMISMVSLEPAGLVQRRRGDASLVW